MTSPKVPAKPAFHELLDRLAPNWPLLLYDGATIDHILSVINNPRPSRTKNHATFAFVGPSRIRIGSSQEAGMIALSLVRLNVIPTNLRSSWSRNSEPP